MTVVELANIGLTIGLIGILFVTVFAIAYTCYLLRKDKSIEALMTPCDNAEPLTANYLKYLKIVNTKRGYSYESI